MDQSLELDICNFCLQDTCMNNSEKDEVNFGPVETRPKSLYKF